MSVNNFLIINQLIVIMSVNNSLYCDPVMRYGTADQQERRGRGVVPRPRRALAS